MALQRDRGRKESQNEKDIHPEYPSCLHGQIPMVQQKRSETVEFEGETLPIDPCGNLL